MPIYEYRCSNGHSFEVMQRMSDGPVTACQICAAPVERVFHAPAVHFKGSGFYNTDYGTKKRAREKESSDSAKSSSDSSAKSGSTGSSDSSSSGSSSGGEKTSTASPAKDAA